MVEKLPDSADLNELLRRVKERQPNAPALGFEGKSISYGEMYRQVLAFAAALKRLGIRKGDRVALMLPNIPEFPVAYFGILYLGAVVVPINTMFRSREIHYILEDSESRAVITWEGELEAVAQAMEDLDACEHLIALGQNLPEGVVNWQHLLRQPHEATFQASVLPEDPAVILYTSGTTGRPKGAILTHRNLCSNASSAALIGGLTSKDISLGVLPFYHSFGQTVSMNAVFCAGGKIVLVPRFSPEAVFESIEKEHVTIFAAVPTMLKILVDYEGPAADLSSVRWLLSGGAKLERTLLEEFERKFGIPVHEGYGLTEASPVVTFNPQGFDRKPGSVGIPLRDIEIRIVDDKGEELFPGEEGEIVVRGPNVMKGYLNRPEATKEILRDGWLYTGDIGYTDEEGYLYIVDRKGDMIIKGGFNVYPREIEELLSHHPSIREVAVVGVPDPVQGEEVKAYVVLQPEARASSNELIDYCVSQIAKYKCPKYISFVQSLPKNALGRVQKHLLKRGRTSREGKFPR